MKGANFYSRVFSLFDRYTVLSPAAITKDTSLVFQKADHKVPSLPHAAQSDQVWLETARLLARSGEWRRAVALIDGLPVLPRRVLLNTAKKERWPIPSDVMRTIDIMNSNSSGDVAGDEGIIDNNVLDFARAQIGAMQIQKGSIREKEVETEPDDIDDEDGTSRMELNTNKNKEMGSSTLVGTTTESLVRKSFTLLRSDGEQIISIFEELQRRGDFKELLQCVSNWQRRGLLSQSTITSKQSMTGGNAPLFDAIKALRVALFPLQSAAARSSLASQEATPPWLIAVKSFPLLFCECILEKKTAERFFTAAQTSASGVLDVIFILLKHIAMTGQKPVEPTVRAGGSMSSTIPLRPTATEKGQVDKLWATSRMLLNMHRAELSAHPKSRKEKLLQLLVEAMKSTANLNPQHSSTAGPHDTLSSIRECIEISCDALLHHDAQVRFIGLPTFAAVTLQTEALQLLLPSSLVQCLFLCLGDRQQVDVPPNAALSNPTKQYLLASRTDRWQHALEMLKRQSSDTHASDFPVTSGHLSALLNGLRSVSVVRTWQAALQCVEFFEKQINVTPGDDAMLNIILNHQQFSWQRAFDVLQYYQGKLAPAHILVNLQLIAVKHGDWQRTLQLMDQLCMDGRQASYMNYLYCLNAAGLSGNIELCLDSFHRCKHARGRRKESRPYTEALVAVVAVALLEGHHYAVAVTLAASLHTSLQSSPEDWTARGVTMIHAMELLGMLLDRQYDAMVQMMNQTTTTNGSAEPVLPDVLQDVLVLYSMVGMSSLRAPIRLVFDTVVGPGAYYRCDLYHRTYETQQRSTNDRRAALYVPHAHQRQAAQAIATALGQFVNVREKELDEDAIRIVASVLARAGVGTEYLKASLL